MRRILFAALAVYLYGSAGLFAQVVTTNVLDDEIDAHINVANLYKADLKVIFEDATGLTPDSVTITAGEISVLELTNRLSNPTLLNLNAGFPIMISITPSPTSDFAFVGVATIELSTSNLTFSPTFRLLTAPSGGVFEDITTFSGVGSYRVSGTGGRFSDFVILADLREKGAVIQSKFDKLQESLTTNASLINPDTLQNLQTKYSAALAAYQAGSGEQAVSNLNEMINLIKADNGNTIPNIYRANDANTKNVAGDLRKRAATLIFSLKL